MAEVLERRAFVGRDRELARLRQALGDVALGRGRTVVIGGEAGIGKTRLLGRFIKEASESGAVVLEGACLRVVGSELPYAPYVEILRALVRGTPPERLPALLGPGRGELVNLVPELATRAADVPAATDLARTSQARLFELVLGVVERQAADAPVVVVIEDLQWADRSTRDLTAFLVRSLREQAVLVVLTVRTDSIHARVEEAAFLAELEHDGRVERIDLRAFDRGDVAEQVSALLGSVVDAKIVDELLERTDGNPFFVEELVLAASPDPAALPPVLRDVLSARVRTLSEPARDVLRAAAVGGRRIDDELLATALGVPPRELGAALREALDSGILVRVEIPPRADGSAALGPASAFRHELLREAVDDDVFPAERVALHTAFAEALEARVAAGRRVPAARIAHHWDAAGRPDRALGPTIEAARSAERVYAFADALRLWETAARLHEAAPEAAAALGMDRAAILEHGAESAVLAGDYARAVALGRAAAAEVDPRTDRTRAGHLQERLRWYLWEAGDRAGAAAALEAVLRLLPKDDPSAELSRAIGHRAGIALFSRDYPRARADAEEAFRLAEAVGATADAAFALGILGWAEAVLGDVEQGIERFRLASRMAEGIGSVEGMALGASSLVSLLDRVGLPARSLDAALEGFALTQRFGVARTYGALLLGFAAKAQHALGLWDDADRTTAEGLRLRPSDRAEMWLLVNRGRLLACRGSFDEAAALLRRAREIDARLGRTEFRTPLLAALAELAVWARRPEDARGPVAEGLEMAEEAGPPDPGLSWLAALGLRALADEAEVARARHEGSRLGSVGVAAGAISAAVERVAGEMATSIAREGGRGMALAGLLEAEAARIRDDERASLWAANAAAWDALARPFPAAYARFREAAMLLATRGSREDATSLLRSAHGTAVRLGAAPLVSEVETLARQARIELVDAGSGARVPTASGATVPWGSYHLTDRELEVIRLVAGGWTNQQIADELFITRKTASVHVSNILAKLGVDSRVEAAAVAHRIGLGADAPPPPDREGTPRP